MLRAFLVLLALTACSAFSLGAPAVAIATPASALTKIEMGRGDKRTAKGATTSALSRHSSPCGKNHPLFRRIV